MSRTLTHTDAAGLLSSYAAQTLTPAQRAGVEEHLRQCEHCRRDLEEWTLIREAVRARAPQAVPHVAVLENIRMSIAPEPVVRHGPRFLFELLWAQVGVVQSAIWSASVLVIALGIVVSLLAGRGGAAILDVLAPVVAAVGISFLYGADNDPPLEIALATPTSPRLILIARLTIVFGYDLLLTLLASVVLISLGAAPVGFMQLVLQWLGPMLLLSSISLWLSLHFGSVTGVTSALLLWVLRVTILHMPGISIESYVATLTSTSIVTIPLAGAMLALTVLQLPLEERFA